MATKNTFQYKQTISVNRDNFIDTVVRNDELGKKDIRVLLHLLTHLDSITPKEISKKHIAEDLHLDKKSVDKCIENLLDMEIISKKSSSSVKNGYVLLF